MFPIFEGGGQVGTLLMLEPEITRERALGLLGLHWFLAPSSLHCSLRLVVQVHNDTSRCPDSQESPSIRSMSPRFPYPTPFTRV